MDSKWDFQQFRSPSGRNAISDWRKGQSPARRAAMDVFLDRMGKMEKWPSGMVDPIRGYSGYWELRWTAEKVEHRIFGYFDGAKRFVMLVGCTHKGKIYDPPGAFETMKERYGKLQKGEGALAKYELVKINGASE